MEFDGKVVLVTGGASGIGRATSLAFARAGAKVAFTYLTSADEAVSLTREIEALGRTVHGIRADLCQPEPVEAVFAEAEERLGPLDVLVANAGGILQRSRIVDLPFDVWNQVIAINLTSTHLCVQAALRRMEPRRRGAIVTMSSLAAFNGGGNGASHYAATKGAISTYTMGVAKEVGPLGIRVNAVAPGLIGTRFHDIFNTPEGRRAVAERTPLRREGTPEDVADTILYLASDRAAFMTGEVVQIAGGLGIA